VTEHPKARYSENYSKAERLGRTQQNAHKDPEAIIFFRCLNMESIASHPALAGGSQDGVRYPYFLHHAQ
jgi:hypothetical protein